jgi:hypothetical protein
MDVDFPFPSMYDEYVDWKVSGIGRFHWPFTETELSLIDAWEEMLAAKTHLQTRWSHNSMDPVYHPSRVRDHENSQTLS